MKSNLLAREWPLAVFTVLLQTAVGAFWTLAVPFVFSAKRIGRAASPYLNVWTLGGIAMLVALGAAVSFFHLGSPFRAANALRNFRTSWLSREIFFELGFLGCMALLAFLRWRGMERSGLFMLCAVAAAVSGLALLVSMSKIYMLDIVPAWRGLYTPLSFFGSSVLLGGLAAVCAVRQITLSLVSAGGEKNVVGAFQEFASFQRAAIIGAVAAAVAMVLVLFALTPGVGFFAAKKATLRDHPASKIWPFVIIRLALLSATLAVLSAILSRGPADTAALEPLLPAAFLCALAAEIVGRLLFYYLYSRVGV